MPTMLIVGLNRSGTTALMQSFLNHPHVEVFKEPGKYKYESTGVADFSHFFAPPLCVGSRARVIKQSIGQYTPELCTIPLYPTLSKRPDFIRQLSSVFLIRDPVETWNSWEGMTRWIQTTEDHDVRRKWRELVADKGISAGWGSYSLYRLAHLYFREVLFYVRHVAPETVSVVALEDLIDGGKRAVILGALCRKLGLDLDGRMIDWELQFGQPCDRISDGIRRGLDDPERKYIHRNISSSRGFRSFDAPLIIDEAVRQRIDGGELGRSYRELRQVSRDQFFG